MKAADSYAIAAIMLQMEGWEKSWERRRIPIYGMQRVYLRVDEFRKAPAGQDCDKPETAQPGVLDLRDL